MNAQVKGDFPVVKNQRSLTTLEMESGYSGDQV